MPSAMQTPNIARGRARKRLAEKRADPEWHAAYKKKQRKYYRITGKFLPNLKRSRQRAYAKLAANPEWRERHNAKTTREVPQRPGVQGKRTR